VVEKLGSLDSRRKRYYELSSAIASIDDAWLVEAFRAAETASGWGRNHVLEIAGQKVFVKRVPLTDLEYENRYSTRNRYNLPTYYNYGIGSAGFGVFRELVANIKVTNWVLAGEIETFPLLYHHRICRTLPSETGVDMDRHQGYVKYWGGDENIGRYMLDRHDARNEMVLFLEHIPQVLEQWLNDHPEQTPIMLSFLKESVDFLRGKGVIHFDAHFHNVVTDGERPYLTDFGLVLDKAFDLSEEESRFFETNVCYDYGEVLACMGGVMGNAYDRLSPEAKARAKAISGFDEGDERSDRITSLLEHAEDLVAAGIVELHPGYLNSVLKYRGVLSLMRRFYTTLRLNPKKDTVLPQAELEEELRRCGYLTD